MITQPDRGRARERAHRGDADRWADYRGAARQDHAGGPAGTPGTAAHQLMVNAAFACAKLEAGLATCWPFVAEGQAPASRVSFFATRGRGRGEGQSSAPGNGSLEACGFPAQSRLE